jgi:DNA helicase II / ATP-dependent DNA helicase PcrA
VIIYPARGIGDTTLEKIEQAASSMNVSMWTIIKHPGHNPANLNKGTLAKIEGFVTLIESFTVLHDTNDAYDLARTIANQSGLIKELHEGDTIEERSRYDNVEELLTGISDYVAANYKDGESPKLAGFLENVALLTDQDTEKPEERNRITMMTIHSAKGLEFPYVYIVGMEEKLFPSEMTVMSPHELEEERRLFYVAITRARIQVTLSYCKNRFRYGSTIQPPPSRFIKDIDSKYISGTLKPFGGFSNSGSFGKREPSGIAETDSPMNRKVPIGLNLAASRKLHQMNQNQTTDFIPSSPASIKAGMNVEHQQFGVGKILQIEGDGNNRKALVFFTKAGEKKLLLQFAKLRIVEN